MVDASRLVEALEKVWVGIQARHCDVPAVVVTLGAGSIGVPAGQLRLGHFAEHRWVNPGDPAGLAELFVGGEGLAEGPRGVLETLLHEAAHGMAAMRKIQDTSRQGRYHNSRYRELGEEIGLTITKTDPIGWSGTALAPGTAEEYADELTVLTHALVSYRHSEHQLPAVGDDGTGTGEGTAGETGSGSATGAGSRPKNGHSLTCGCRRRIRASAAVVEAGPIVCGLCGTAFEPA